jgi:hypothetical protein
LKPELARRLSVVQERLEWYYALESAPRVTDFVMCAEGVRETTFVRQTTEGVDLAVVLPASADGTRSARTVDETLQLVEGVSHFLYLAERARTELPTTHLELELQAEVDKFVVLELAPRLHRRTRMHRSSRARRLHEMLYTCIRHLHPETTEAGKRYRLANDLAARMMRRVLDNYDPERTRGFLRRFYRAGQTEKLGFAGNGGGSWL